MFRLRSSRAKAEFSPAHFVCVCEKTLEIQCSVCGCLLMLVAALLTSCSSGGAGTGTAASTSSSSGTGSAISVAVAPQSVIVPTGGTTQFAATVANLSNAALQWQVNSVPGGNGTMGTIDSTGLYHAPSTVPGASIEVTAALQTNTQTFGSANVIVVPPVSVSPRQAAVTTSQTVQFQISSPGTGGLGVNLSASGGTITSSGLFTPPGAGVFTVTATSRSDSTVSASATVYVTSFAGQSSWRNDAGLTGQNPQELALNPTTLAAGGFGKVSSCPVDGQVHAQPLYAVHVAAGGFARNIVYVATEHDSVYAFDADAIPCNQIWMTSFLDPITGATTVPSQDIPDGDISPEVGIAGTPVIDQTTGTLYVVARTKEDGPLGPNYFQRLHALDMATGREKFGGPVVIVATAKGAGDGSNGAGQIGFDPLIQSQRAALTLAGGKLFIVFGGHGETSTYHGWLLIYDAATLAQVGVFNVTPNGSPGGFSENGAGVSADASGYVMVATGHGIFDSGLAAPLRKDFGQTLLRLQPSPSLAIVDTFTPSNQSTLTNLRNDLGSTGAVILPDQTGTATPHLAIMGGTNGMLYVVNRDNLGGFVSGGPDKTIKTLNLANAVYGTPAFWQNSVYVAAAGDAIKTIPLSAGTLANAPSSQSSLSSDSPGPRLSFHRAAQAAESSGSRIPAAPVPEHLRCCTPSTPPTWRANSTTARPNRETQRDPLPG